MIVTLLLLALLAVATATDLSRRKIYNRTTYSGMVAALLLGVLGDYPALTAEIGGWVFGPRDPVGLVGSIWGLLACGTLMLACYVFFSGTGGGDVKLLAMVGAFLGVYDGIEAVLWTFVLGACMGLIVLVWRVGPWQLVVRVFRQTMWTLKLGRWSPLSEEEHEQLQTPLHLAPNTLLAVIIVRFHLIPIF